jgi:hypothetical protein
MHAFTDMQPGNFAPVLLASLMDTWATRGSSIASRRMCWAEYPDGKPGSGRRCAPRSPRCWPRQNNPLRGLYPVHEGSAAPMRWAASAIRLRRSLSRR